MVFISKFLARLLAGTSLALLTALAGQYCLAQGDDAVMRPVPVVEQVNINEADAETLADVLQGVGASRARAIVEYREQNGPFDSLEELTEVKGIGAATLDLNRERIVLK